MLNATLTAASRGAHLVPVPGGTWSLWRQVCVRGAGFPAEQVLRLAAPDAAELADRVLEAEARGVPDEALTALRTRLEQGFTEATLRVSRALRELARDPRLREAVAWQNRRALRTGIDVLARRPAEGGDRKVREKERLLASYLQRYCVKNDSIGFFGPVGWGRLAESGPDLRQEPGPELLLRREVYFESWCIDELARALDPLVRAWVCPRLVAYARVEEGRLRIGARAPLALTCADARLLEACDGVTPAREIVALAASAAPGLDEATAWASLERFRQRGLLVWTLEGPLELHPERTLRARLARVGDEGVRAAAQAALDELEAARAGVALAAGDPERLERALDDLERVFTRLTGAAPSRHAGQTYAARTLVYEDARRDLHFELGPGFLQRLGPVLSLVGHSARWCGLRYARRQRAALERAYDALVEREGTPSVSLSACLPLALQTEDALEPFDEVVAEVQARWAVLLGLPSSAARLELRVRDLAAGVEAAFDAPGPGTRWGRYLSPDVLVAAADADALARGDYLIVLGEVHLAHTHLLSAIAAQNPWPEQAARGLEHDLGAPAVRAEVSKEVYCQRLNVGIPMPWAQRYEYGREHSDVAPEWRLRRADLLLERRAGRLEVRTRDGRTAFDALEFVSFALMWSVANRFTLLPASAHTPRITVDGVVLARERWQRPAAELDFARLTSPPERFLAARRWARAAGVPRFAFFKVPQERKPCYVDFDSPVYVDLVAKLVRAAAPRAAVTFTEMLPDVAAAWLVDARGRRYTSELRLVAVDAAEAVP